MALFEIPYNVRGLKFRLVISKPKLSIYNKTSKHKQVTLVVTDFFCNYFLLNQFSMFRFSKLIKSFSLSVTSVNLFSIAVTPTNKSN